MLAVLLKHNIVNSILTWMSLKSSWTVPSFSKYCRDVTFALLYAPYYQAFICRIPPLYHLHTLIQHPAMPCLLPAISDATIPCHLAALQKRTRVQRAREGDREVISMLPPSCRRIIAQLLVRYRVSLTPRILCWISCWASSPLYRHIPSPLWLAPLFQSRQWKKGSLGKRLDLPKKLQQPQGSETDGALDGACRATGREL
ncbi:hypothetical protein GGI42DRAFT_105352 [Trichoderma sp. SZMC 28013]